MVQVLPAVPSFGAEFGRALGTGAGQGIAQGVNQGLQQRQLNKEKKQKEDEEHKKAADAAAEEEIENQMMHEKFGIDLTGIKNPKMRQQIIASQLRGVQEQEKAQMKQQEAIAPLQAGLQTIQQMRKLGEGGNLGVIGGFSKEYRRDRAEYEQLGKSLISLASTIPIRNQKEFETLSSKLYDPALTDATREGILNAMERIIQQSMAQYQQHPLMRGEQQMQQQAAPQQKKPLSSFG